MLKVFVEFFLGNFTIHGDNIVSPGIVQGSNFVNFKQKSHVWYNDGYKPENCRARMKDLKFW